MTKILRGHPQMLETLASEIACLNQQPMPGGLRAYLHPGCGLLNGGETMVVGPLEHHPVALGNTHVVAVDTILPYLRTLSGQNPASPWQFFQRGCAT